MPGASLARRTGRFLLVPLCDDVAEKVTGDTASNHSVMSNVAETLQNIEMRMRYDEASGKGAHAVAATTVIPSEVEGSREATLKVSPPPDPSTSVSMTLQHFNSSRAMAIVPRPLVAAAVTGGRAQRFCR